MGGKLGKWIQFWLVANSVQRPDGYHRHPKLKSLPSNSLTEAATLQWRQRAISSTCNQINIKLQVTSCYLLQRALKFPE